MDGFRISQRQKGGPATVGILRVSLAAPLASGFEARATPARAAAFVEAVRSCSFRPPMLAGDAPRRQGPAVPNRRPARPAR